MPLLPKPFQDEIIGSVFCRAMRHNGLTLYAQTRAIYGECKTKVSFLMCSQPKVVGRLAGLDAEELLMQHTMLPYSTAFVPERLKVKFLSNAVLRPENSTTDLVRPFTRGVSFRRMCPECVKKELQFFGETYWHRRHHLPGVLNCPEHGTELKTTIIPLSVTADQLHTSLPGEVPCSRLSVALKAQLLESVTTLSLQALTGTVSANHVNWFESARNKALKAGYLLSAGKVATKLLEVEINKAFGEAYLLSIGCEVRPPDSWAATVVRAGSSATLTTTKHILFTSFIDSVEQPRQLIKNVYQKRGRKFKDRTSEDEHLSEKLSQAIGIAVSAGRDRISIKDLFLIADYTVFVLHRDSFPLTSAIVNKFKSSEMSVHQVKLP
jgi:hypothetical protein